MYNVPNLLLLFLCFLLDPLFIPRPKTKQFEEENEVFNGRIFLCCLHSNLSSLLIIIPIAEYLKELHFLVYVFLQNRTKERKLHVVK